jgi:GntR family transcriptional regulator/MocR family aminotransferase
VYIQISQQIINAIQRSYLAGGSLCPEPEFSQLNVHRNTAVAVYDELAFKVGEIITKGLL